MLSSTCVPGSCILMSDDLIDILFYSFLLFSTALFSSLLLISTLFYSSHLLLSTLFYSPLVSPSLLFSCRYLMRPGPDVVIADEAHTIKDPKAKINISISRIGNLLCHACHIPAFLFLATVAVVHSFKTFFNFVITF